MYDVTFKIKQKECTKPEIGMVYVVYQLLMNQTVENVCLYFVNASKEEDILKVGIFVETELEEEAKTKAEQLVQLIGYEIHTFDSLVKKEVYGRRKLVHA